MAIYYSGLADIGTSWCEVPLISLHPLISSDTVEIQFHMHKIEQRVFKVFKVQKRKMYM